MLNVESYAQTIRYVKSGGSGNGSSWVNASGNLQAMINASNGSAGDQVWVAAGTYKPTLNAIGISVPARTRTFLMKAGVKIYGGFFGDEPPAYNLSLRNFITNTTTLSGDIDNNDNVGNIGGNVFHVVTGVGSASTILDGFTITAGNANVIGSNQGGGMYNSAGSPTVNNCIFTGNNASLDGGGMYNTLGSPIINKCTFSGNQAGSGGGISNSLSSLKLTDCTFTGNSAVGTLIGEGGGMYTVGGIPELTNCTFTANSANKNGGALSFSTTDIFPTPPLLTNCHLSENTAGIFGGGIYCYASSLRLTDCTVSKNTATSNGGGMYNTGNITNTLGSSSLLTNCIFSENKGASGGGMYNATANCSPKLTNCSFPANDATLDEGGGIYTAGGSPELTNCVFSGNRSKSHGGGMSNTNNAAPKLTNCTFSGNSTTNSSAGGGAISSFSSNPILINCLIWNNRTGSGMDAASESIYNLSSANPSISYSLIAHSGGSGSWNSAFGSDGGNNLDTDPLFVTPIDLTATPPPTTAGDLRLRICSPAINVGTNGTFTNTDKDADGNLRIIAATVDLGAYEFQGGTLPTPDNVTIVNSSCGAGCIVGGGSISAPTGTTCPVGATLQYQVDGGIWGATLPTYIQTGSGQTIKTRCICNADPTTFSAESAPVTTVPGTVPAPVVPANGSLTVACLAAATAPVLPTVNDCGGSPITPGAPVITDSPNPITCEGTRTYAYTYTCGGQSSTWSFVYTIDREPFTIATPNGALTVNNPALAIPPALPTVLSNCGETLTPSAPVITNSPNPLTCEGTRTYAYTYTDCAGNTATWSFVYTVIDDIPPTIVCPSNITVCESSLVTYIPPVGTDNCINPVTIQTAGLPSGNVFPVGITTNVFKVTATNGVSTTCSFTVTVNPLPTASISGTTIVCQNAPSPVITFTGNTGTAPFTFTYKINNGADQTVSTSIGNSVTVAAPTGTAGVFVYTLVSVKESSSTQCSQNQSGTATIQVNTKPTISLNVNGQTLNEGNTRILCDTDANPVNGLQFTVSSSCVVGSPVWRVQVGSGAWSDWNSTAPTTQPSNNTAYRYQAACDGACSSTFTEPITLTINYRASTPQNVSLVADGTTIAAGESKTICNLEGNTLTFNTTCSAGEILLYSVDGGDYSNVIPSQITDGNFHNYRVRCRKADNTLSCVETESEAMSLRITTIATTPTAGISPLSGCGTPSAFIGSTNCGVLSTIWYNATTNQPLASLPAVTPNETTSFYARCQNEAGCLSEKSNTVTFTLTPVNVAPIVSVSSEIVCTGTQVTVSTTCPVGANVFWNTGVSESSFQVSFNNVTKQSYWAKCIFPNGCQSPESVHKTVLWKAFELTFINIGQSQSAVKPANDRNLWTGQFITPDGGPVLENSTEANPTIYYSENVNKTAPRFWTIQVEACNLGTNGSVTYDLLAAPEVGVVRSYNTHENNAPYLMYANRDGFTELYAQNHPAYGFFADNGSGGNTYDTGLPKGLYKLGVRYWDQKGQGSIYPSTRQPQGNVLAYQEYWFRIQSQNGVGTGSTRVAADLNPSGMTKVLPFAEIMPNPVSKTLHLKVHDAKGETVKVSLLDASGRTLLQRDFVPETNQHQEEFEVSDKAAGMYFLRVNTNEKHATLKVVKVQ